MPSILSQLAGLFPAFRAKYAPGVPTREEQAQKLLELERQKLERSRARPAPQAGERVARNTFSGGGIAGRVWFLPYADSTTADTPEIRAAMRLMRTDAFVKTGWEPQILSVESEDWQIQPSEPGNPYSEEQADFVKRVFEDYTTGGMSAIVRAIAAPLGSDGHSVCEKVWAVARKGRLRGRIVLEKLPARDTDPNVGEIRLEGDSFGNVTHVVPLRTNDGRRDPISINDFVYSRYLGVFGEPLGEAAFRPVYGPYWMRDTLRKLRVIYHEKHMAGLLLGKYKDDDDKPALDAALELAKANTWLSVPDSVQIEMMTLSTASESDFKSFDESLSSEIVQGLAFATLQSLQGTVPDARGSAAAQKSMSELGPWLIMKIVTQGVNSQLIPDLIDFNYAYPAAGGYPKLTFGAVSNGELIELLDVVERAQRIGLKPSRKYYAQSLSIQEADENDPDDALEPPGAGGGMPGMGGVPPGADPFGGGGDPFGGPPEPPLPPEPDAGGEPFGFAEAVHHFRETGDDGHLFPALEVPDFDRAAFFSDAVQPAHFFAWVRAETKGRSGYKAVWQGEGARRPIYGPRAKKALEREAARAKPPGTPASAPAVDPPAAGAPAPAPSPVAPIPQQSPGPVDPAPGPNAAPARGRVRAAAGAVARGAGRAGTKLAGKGLGTVNRLARVPAVLVRRLGSALKKWRWLEDVTTGSLLGGRTFGIGTMLERMGLQKISQIDRNEELLAEGELKEAGKRIGSGTAKNSMANAFYRNRRKYGVATAIGLELLSRAIKAAGAVAVGALAGGFTATGVSAGLAAGYAIEKLFGFVATPISRKIAEYPFRRFPKRGRSGLNRPDRAAEYKVRAAREAKEATAYRRGPYREWKAAARAARKAGRPIPPRPASPAEERERRIAAKWGADPVAERPARYAPPLPRPLPFSEGAVDVAAPDPEQLVLDAREQIEDAFAADGKVAPEVTDEWIVEFLNEFLARMAERVQSGTAAVRSSDAFAERVHRFAWTAARSSRRNVMAIGTGEDAGKKLYGRDAERALQRQAGAGARKTADQRVQYTKPGDPPETVKAVVSAATARELALQSALANIDGDPLAPRDFKVLGRASKRLRRPAAAATRAVASGDPEAVRSAAASALGDLSAAVGPESVAAPAPPAERAAIKGAFAAAAKGLKKGEAKAVFDRLDGFMAGVVGASSSDEIFDRTVAASNSFAAWLRDKPAAVVGRVLGAVGRFAARVVRFAGPISARLFGAGVRAGWSGVKGLARAGWGAGRRIGGEILESAGELLGLVARPVGRGLARLASAGGRLVGAAAILAASAAVSGGIFFAPALAVKAGLLTSFWGYLGIGFAAAVPAIRAWWFGKGLAKDYLMRRGRFQPQRYVYAGTNTPAPAPGSFAEHENRFGPPLTGSWFTFAWSDWKPTADGKGMVSPGGRTLSKAMFDKMSKGGGGGEPAKAKPAAAEEPEPAALGGTYAVPAGKARAGQMVSVVGPGTAAGYVKVRAAGGDEWETRAANVERQLPPAAPEPGRVYEINPGAIEVDPERFQFKLNVNKGTGVGKELERVAVYDPELAGVLALWRDPANGKTYVVNGHHRLELARRAGAPTVAGRYLKAQTAEEARAKGALINIAEGRGTAVDAAKFLRDTGRSAEDLAAVGVSLTGAVARDAVPLSKLSPTLFRKVTFGALDPARAVALATHLDKGRDQEQLADAIEKREQSTGRPISAAVVEAMAKEFRDAPRRAGSTETLFGAIEDDDTTYFARAELKSFVRNELAKEAKDFRLGASKRRAEVLGQRAGNALNVADNRTAADAADAALATFDGQSTRKGELSDLLNQLATEYDRAGSTQRPKLRARALAAVRALLSGGRLEPTGGVGERGPGLFE